MSESDSTDPSSRHGGAGQQARPAGKWLILMASAMGTLVLTLDSGMVGVSYPALAEAFDTDSSTVLWTSVVYWVTGIGLVVTIGWVADVGRRRTIFSLGFIVLTLGIAFSALSTNMWQLIASRIFQGVGSAMLLANVNAIITQTFPARERGKALGISGAAVGAGLSAGPVLGGLLLDALSWRALFYTRIPLSLLGAALAWRVLPTERKVPGTYRIDYLGAAALFATLASFLLVVNQGSERGFASPFVLGMFAFLVVSVPLLVWSQRRSVRPILDFALFRRSQFSIGLGVQMCHYLALGAILLLAPFYFVDALGFSATRMGVFITAYTLARTFLAPFSGWLSDKTGAWLPTSIGQLVLGAALLWLSRLGTGGSEGSILASLMLVGVGSAFFEPPNTSSIMGSVPRDRLGTASAAVASGRQIAFAIGVAVAGAIFTIRERAYLDELVSAGTPVLEAGREAIARGFSDALLAGVVLAGLGVVLAISGRKSDGHAVDDS